MALRQNQRGGEWSFLAPTASSVSHSKPTLFSADSGVQPPPPPPPPPAAAAKIRTRLYRAHLDSDARIGASPSPRSRRHLYRHHQVDRRKSVGQIDVSEAGSPCSSISGRSFATGVSEIESVQESELCSTFQMASPNASLPNLLNPNKPADSKDQRFEKEVPDYHDEGQESDETKLDKPESQVEEKIIRAVHARSKIMMKPIISDSLNSGEKTRENDLSGIIRAEIRQAVTDITKDLTQKFSDQNTRPTKSMDDHVEGELTKKSSVYEGIIKALTDACKGYALRLYESEKDMQKLRLELEVERRQYLEMAKLIKELIPSCTSIPKNLEGLGQKNTAVEEVGKEMVLSMAFSTGLGSNRSESQTVVSLKTHEDTKSSLNSELIEKEFLQKSWSDPEVETLRSVNKNNIIRKKRLPKMLRKKKGDKIRDALKAREIVSKPDCPLSKDGVFLPWLQLVEADTESNSEGVSCKDGQTKHKEGVRRTKLRYCNMQRQWEAGNNSSSINSTEQVVFGEECYGSCKDNVRTFNLLSGTHEFLINRSHLANRIKAGELVLCSGSLEGDIL